MWVDSFLGQTEQGVGSCNKMKSLKLQSASCSEQRERWGALTQPSSCFVTCTGDPCPHVPLSHLFLGFLPGGLGRTPLCLVWGSPGSCIAAGGALAMSGLICRMGVPGAVPRSLRGPQTQWGRRDSRSCAHSVPPPLLFWGRFSCGKAWSQTSPHPAAESPSEVVKISRVIPAFKT